MLTGCLSGWSAGWFAGWLWLVPRGAFCRLWLAAVGLLWVGWLACFPDLSSRLAHTEEQRASVKALLAQNFVIRGLIRDASFGKQKSVSHGHSHTASQP